MKRFKGDALIRRAAESRSSEEADKLQTRQKHVRTILSGLVEQVNILGDEMYDSVGTPPLLLRDKFLSDMRFLQLHEELLWEDWKAAAEAEKKVPELQKMGELQMGEARLV